MYLTQAVDATLSELKECLRQLDNSIYCQPLEIYSGSTLGQHTRHVIEFYQCLLRQSVEGLINYDQRERDLRIESDTDFAMACIDEIIHRLEHETFNNHLQLEVCYDLEKDVFAAVPTNFERELVYNLEHTIHHLAILKIGLKVAAPHVKIPAGFGVAISTTKYKNTACAQ